MTRQKVKEKRLHLWFISWEPNHWWWQNGSTGDSTATTGVGANEELLVGRIDGVDTGNAHAVSAMLANMISVANTATTTNSCSWWKLSNGRFD